MKMIGKIRKVITIILVNCLVLVLLLALLELTGWLMFGRPAHGFLHGFLHASWRLNHTYLKSSCVHPTWVRYHPDFTQPYTRVYNQQGWSKNYDITPQKPKGTYRIFYVGDSFIEGMCPMEQSLPDIIERRLNQYKRDKNLRIEVINTGTASYSPILYYINIRYFISNYKPDLIVVAVDMTDDCDDWRYKPLAFFDNEGNPWAVHPADYSLVPYGDVRQGAVRATLFLRVQYFLYRNSSFYNMMRIMIQSNRKAPPNRFEPGGTGSYKTTIGKRNKGVLYQYWQWCQEPWDSLTTVQVQATLDYIRRICEFCRSRNIKLMLTSVPHYKQYNGDAQGKGMPSFSSRPHAEIAGVARRCGVPYHNAYEDLKSLITGTPEKQYYFPGDFHFNPRGNHLWADAQYKFLSDSSKHLLPVSFY